MFAELFPDVKADVSKLTFTVRQTKAETQVQIGELGISTFIPAAEKEKTKKAIAWVKKHQAEKVKKARAWGKPTRGKSKSESKK